MGRMIRVLSAAFVATALPVWPSSAAPGQAGTRAPELRTVNAVVAGTITGVVSDERGGPLHGAMVSVLGATMAMTLTDDNVIAATGRPTSENSST